jgi:RNA-binding protein
MSPFLTSKQRAHLRALAHALAPVVQIGRQGTTEAVVAQVDEALVAHELIKVRLGRECPDSPEEAGLALERATGAEIVQVIGRTLVVYRAREESLGVEPLDAPRAAGGRNALRRPAARGAGPKVATKEDKPRPEKAVPRNRHGRAPKKPAPPRGQRARPRAGANRRRAHATRTR